MAGAGRGAVGEMTSGASGAPQWPSPPQATSPWLGGGANACVHSLGVRESRGTVTSWLQVWATLCCESSSGRTSPVSDSTGAGATSSSLRRAMSPPFDGGSATHLSSGMGWRMAARFSSQPVRDRVGAAATATTAAAAGCTIATTTGREDSDRAAMPTRCGRDKDSGGDKLLSASLRATRASPAIELGDALPRLQPGDAAAARPVIALATPEAAGTSLARLPTRVGACAA